MKPKHWLLLILILAGSLRLFNLAHNPPSLYWDEVSIGYNAFSIIQNGTDEHGNSWPITHFLAFGDAKPPLYIYATSIAMAIVGVGDLAVRLPSAFAGVLAVLFTYLLTLEIFKSNQHKHHLALTSATLMAISPWHLHMSRVGYEANLALAFFLIGLWAFFRGLTQPKYYFLTTITFISTLYTFNAYRIFLPFFLLILALTHRKTLLQQAKPVATNLFLALLLVIPLVPFVLSDQAKLRFNEVTIFNNHQPILEANQRIQLNQNAFWAKLLHNRRLLFALDFLRHYTDHFKPDFLFFSGDVNPRLSVRDLGMLYYIELPLLLIGIYALFTQKFSPKWLLTFWILAAIIPAGVARETPHALRTLQVLPAPQIIIALGIITLISKHKKITPILISAYLLLFAHYLDIYHLHYPKQWQLSWQYGYKPLFSYLQDIQADYDRIFITNHLDRCYINALYYLQIDPQHYLATRDSGGDAFGFTYTNSFGKFYFTPYDQSSKPSSETWLVVSPPDSMIESHSILHTIYDLKHQPVFVIQEI